MLRVILDGVLWGAGLAHYFSDEPTVAIALAAVAFILEGVEE